ncbi:MAG: glycosyltransferase family 9 protein [Ignavibacteria bacterium]|jgi:heptosyltransferase-2
MAQNEFEIIKYDCRFFKGSVPCTPNKLYSKICGDCDLYSPISTRILIIKLGALGDVIRSTPLVVYFKNTYPGCHITWLTMTPEILLVDEIDVILPFNLQSMIYLDGHEYDIAVNLDKEAEVCILLEKLKAKLKFGFNWNNNHIDAATPASTHKLLTGIFDSYSKNNKKSYQEEIFEICQAKFSNEPYLLPLDKKYFNKWEMLRIEAGVRKIIGLNTGCGKRWQTRLWSFDYWVELINLLKSNNFFPVLLGGPDEDETNKKLNSITSSYYPGTYSLSEFIAIVAHCDLIVTAVSMMMHIAIGLQKPLILFNNIFNKNEFELYGRGVILEPSTGCDCYYGNNCVRDRHCMLDITPEMTYKAIMDNT